MSETNQGDDGGNGVPVEKGDVPPENSSAVHQDDPSNEEPIPAGDGKPVHFWLVQRFHVLCCGN